MDKTPIERACEAAGGQAALARAIDNPKVTPAVVWQWLNKIRPVPSKYAVAIERAANGAVTRQEICPDFPWGEPEKRAA